MRCAHLVINLLLLLAVSVSQLQAADILGSPHQPPSQPNTTTPPIIQPLTSTAAPQPVPSSTEASQNLVPIAVSDNQPPLPTPVPVLASSSTASVPASSSEVQNLSTTTLAPALTTDTTSNTTRTNATETNKQEPLLIGVKTIIDLSYPLDNNTLHWPKNDGFKYEDYVDGELQNERNETYYLKSDGIHMAVHTGTHLDAPRHFSKDGWTVDKIPLERLVDVPFQVIDLSYIVDFNRTYEFTVNDFLDRKTNSSLVKPRSVVLVYTGLSNLYYQGEEAYFGTKTKNISEMRIPGFSGQAAKYLVEMGVYGVGLDAPSADSSRHHSLSEQYDPEAHAIFTSNNIYILENINNRLSALINADESTRLTIAPLPISGASGSPVRLLAVTVHSDCPMALNSGGTSTLLAIKSFATIAPIAAIIYTTVAILMI